MATDREPTAMDWHDANARFVDVFTPMLDAGGHSRPELYVEDRLHMSAAGYALWAQHIAPALQ